MRSDAEIKDVFYTLLKGSDLDNVISGSIYKISRPANSDLEDVTIHVLDGLNGQVQNVVVNVNVYVLDVNYRVGEFVQDEIRVRELSNLCIKLLDGFSCDDYLLEIEKQPVFSVEGCNQHVINNRVLFKIMNV